MDAHNAEPITILIAEDDDGHAELIQEYFKEAGVNCPIIRFRDGQETLNFLNRNEGKIEKQDGKPYLLLLDINMPRMDGVGVLRHIKSTPKLWNIPVIMLTTTDDPREVEECYKLGCNGYVTKPVAFADFSETLKRLGLFLMILRVAKVHI